jgi:hypothetical protein
VTPRKPETGLFLLPEREKAIAKRQERPRYGLFLDRQREKAIANADKVHETVFSSTGRGKRPSQTRAKSMKQPFPRQAGGKGNRKRTPSPMMTFSSTGRGKRPSQPHAESHDGLFRVRQGEKDAKGTPRVIAHSV